MYSAYPDCRRLFFCAGEISRKPEDKIRKFYVDWAWEENRELFLKILFYLMKSDDPMMKHLIRAGFRCLVDSGAENHDQEGIDALKARLDEDLSAMKAGELVSPLARWLPSVNATSSDTVELACRLAKYFGMTKAEYRKTLSVLRRVWRKQEEEKKALVCAGAELQEEAAVPVHQVPELCDIMGRIFRRELEKDERNRSEIIERMNPLSEEEKAQLDARWRNLPDYETGKTVLVVPGGDVSLLPEHREGIFAGDMETALAMYFSERNEGYWHSRYDVASGYRHYEVDIKGDAIYEKKESCINCENLKHGLPAAGWGKYRTGKVHLLNILGWQMSLATSTYSRDVENGLADVIYIVGSCSLHERIDFAAGPQLERYKRHFQSAGLKIPQIVYWNLGEEALRRPVSVTENESGITIITGYSPEILEDVLRCRVSPWPQMRDALESKEVHTND